MQNLEAPELQDILAKLDENDSLSQDRHFLTNEVRFSDLRKMTDANLEGRYESYFRDYTFELHKQKREEFYREVVRTKLELMRRAHERRQAAVEEALTGPMGKVAA